MFKRLFLIVLLLFGVFFSSLAPVLADEPSPNPGNELPGGVQWNADQELINQYTEATQRCTAPSLECLVYYVVNYTAIEITRSIAPVGADLETSPDGGSPSMRNDNATMFSLNSNDPSYRGPVIAGKRGLLPGLGALISMMYESPVASTETYVADVMHSAGVTIAPPAQAQGLGFVALNPVMELWRTFRNVAYIFYVLMFIAIGFMIMFRQKLGQQAITAQQAIPSIIVSLIMVTFSYAIAGFLIDIMYLVMFLVVGVFDQTSGIGSEVIGYNIFKLGATFLGAGFSAGRIAGAGLVSDMIDATFGSGDRGLLQRGVEWVGGITVGVVIAIAVLISTFKLFFELLKSYASVVLHVVTAPLQLMVGAIPGNNAVSGWIKNLIGNLSPFPVVLLAFVMFKIFTEGAHDTEGGFMPPFLLNSGTSDTIVTLMGLAILLAIPEIVKHAKEKIGATAGFGEMVAKAGLDRTQQAWSGKGLPMGVGAKHIVKAGATVGGGAALGAVGAGLGGLGGAFWGAVKTPRTGGSFIGNALSMGKRGAVGLGKAGMMAPVKVPMYTKIAKGAIKTTKDEWRQKKEQEALQSFGRNLHRMPFIPDSIKSGLQTNIDDALIRYRINHQLQSQAQPGATGATPPTQPPAAGSGGPTTTPPSSPPPPPSFPPSSPPPSSAASTASTAASAAQAAAGAAQAATGAASAATSAASAAAAAQTTSAGTTAPTGSSSSTPTGNLPPVSPPP